MARHGLKQAASAVADDAVLAGRALARDAGAFRTIMQKHNRRLYRIARGILRDNTEAEDAVQDAYVSAFTQLASYRGESTLATWLSRIVMNEALGRLRRRRPTVDLAALDSVRSEAEIIQFPLSTPSDDPERTMAQRQILQLVEQATDNLPEVFRLVFVTRVIEGMSVEETSELLGIKPETVKTRLHRAHRFWGQSGDRDSRARCLLLTQSGHERLRIAAVPHNITQTQPYGRVPSSIRGASMRRRDFITLIGGAAAGWPIAARGQQAEQMRRIGVLMSLAADDPRWKALLAGLRDGLARLGWIEGSTIHIDYRFAGGDPDQFSVLAKELVALHPEVIFAQSTPVTAALKRETHAIASVFVEVSDPIGSGFIASLAHPGGNLTGIIQYEPGIAGIPAR